MTEGESRARGAQAHELIDLALDAVFTRSFEDRVITSWNEGAERLYGFSRGEALGKPAPELLCSRYPIPLEQIEDELRRAGRWRGEIEQYRKDGSTVRVECRWELQNDSSGDPFAILEINSDAVARSAIGERLRSSDERFSLLVSAVSEYAIFMLDPDGTIATWNGGAQRIKGYAADEIVGKHFSIFYTPEDIAGDVPARALRTAEDEGVFKAEGWRVRKDGTRFWASVVITALRENSGRLRGFAKVTRDITERHQEDARLREYARQMAELEQSKARFLDLAAHELRGPLTLIRGYNSLLGEGKLDPARLPEISRVLESKLEQIDLLVWQMLEMGRLENDRMDLDLATVDLFEVARGEVGKLRPLAGGRRIEVEGEKASALVNADRHRIGTVIGNLVDNAIKYSPQGGDVGVRVGRDDTTCFVSVRDRGLGIDADHIPLLFKRYVRLPTTANESISGTGLGLYLCQEIAQRHAGEITVESVLGKGSEFTLRLPALDRA